MAARREAEAARRKAEAARGREAAAAQQVGRCCELRQPDGKEEVAAKSQGKGGGGVTTGATRQPAGKQEANRKGGVQLANGRGGVSGQEVTKHQEDERWQQHDVRRRDNQPEAPVEAEPPPPSSYSLAFRWEGGDQSVYLDSFLTEHAPEPEKKTVNAVPEMGFLTSGNGTSTGNGRPISSTGKLRVWVLTDTPLKLGPSLGRPRAG